MKNIVIVGGSGSLGNYLIKNLSQNFNLISLSKSYSKNTKINYVCDLLNLKKLNQTIYKIKNKYPYLDCIIFTVGDSKKMIKKNYEKKININFNTFRNLLDCYCKVYKFSPTKIIIISSIVTEKFFEDAPIEYTLAKSLLKKFVIIKAKELAKNNINLNLISPGNILIPDNNWSKRLKTQKKKTLNYIKKNVPIKKFIDPKIIQNTCELILDDSNNCYTGANFILDGGQTL